MMRIQLKNGLNSNINPKNNIKIKKVFFYLIFEFRLSVKLSTRN